MGSVPHFYTTGDNDPEIGDDPEGPTQYYRHYLYCDACGSFDLGAWLTPDNHEALETTGRGPKTTLVFMSGDHNVTARPCQGSKR